LLLLLLLLHVPAAVRWLLRPAARVRSLPLQVVRYAAWLLLLLLLHIWLPLILLLLLLLGLPAVVLPPAIEPLSRSALPVAILHWPSCTGSSSSIGASWDLAIAPLHSSKPRRGSLGPTSSSSRRYRWFTSRAL
jgi:hypothetical protein